MIDFLIRHFIKDYENVSNEAVRRRYCMFGGAMGIFCSVLLFAAKFLIGIFAHSVSVLTDSFHNLSDAGASVVTIIGASASAKPPDRKHPFGHGRIEYVAGLIVALIIVTIGLQFLISSVQHILTPEKLAPNLFMILILAATVLVNIWLWTLNRGLGKTIRSPSLTATSVDNLNDVLATGSTILSLLLYFIFHINIDAYIGCLVAAVVIYAGVKIARETLSPLIGEPAARGLADDIYTRLLGCDEVIGCHDLIVHNYGPTRRLASVHAEVPDDMTLNRVHAVLDKVEQEIYRDLGISITIHTDPIPTHDENARRLHEELSVMIRSIDPRVTMHELHLSPGETPEMVFDIVVPSACSEEDALNLVGLIAAAAKERYPRYHCKVNVDENFIGDEEEE